MFVQGFKAGARISVIIGGQRAWMCFQAERAKRTRQAGHFSKEFCRMTVFGQQEMPKRRQTGVNGVQEPKLRDAADGHSGLKLPAWLLALVRNRGAFSLQNFDQPLQHID
jgi:hypothetical protein